MLAVSPLPARQHITMEIQNQHMGSNRQLGLKDGGS